MATTTDTPRALRREGLARRGAPFALAAIAGLLTVPLPPPTANPLLVTIASVLTAAILAGGYLLPWARLPRWTEAVAPLSYILVVALLREAQGGADSGYGPLCILPVVWLALHGRRREVGAAIAAVGLLFTLPLLIQAAQYDHSEWRSSILWTMVSALVGLTVHSLVTARRCSEVRAHQYAASLEAVASVARQAVGGDARTSVCEAARTITGAAVAILMEPDGHGHLVSSSMVGLDRGPARVNLAAAPQLASVQAFTTGEPVFVATAIGNPAVPPGMAGEGGTRSILFQPVVRGLGTVGVLVVAWDRPVAGPSEREAATIALLAIEAGSIIERADLVARLERQAATDELTGLPNRRSWERELPRELARARRTGTALTVAMLDLDHFKAFNDANGHQAGDRLLRGAAAAWWQQLRETDVLARYGGEEFAIALPAAGAGDAAVVLERIRSVVPEGQSCSVGLAQWDGDESPEALLRRSDDALYAAKAAGRDQIVVAGAALSAVVTPA